MALDWKWLHATLNLGAQVVVHYLKKLWPWSPRYGLERFQHNYVVEGLPPATSTSRSLAHEPGRCTVCGVCDRACPVLGDDVVARDFAGPMAFVVAGARAAPHADDVADALRVLTSPGCADCRRCEAACPESIPILAVARAVQDARDVVVQAQRGVLPLAPRGQDPKMLQERS